MSKITITPNGAGTGTFSIASPNSNTNRTLTLPDSTGELLNAESSLNAAKLTGALPAIDASNVTGLPAPFAPVAVTGTTPSLNVGTYNYFDNGTLTADTTVSFASVPTTAQWKYAFTPSNTATPYDTSLALSDTVASFSVAAQDATVRGVEFKTDGTKMYHAGRSNDGVYEYALSTAWDISTAVFTVKLSVVSQDNDPEDLSFSPDGIYLYVMGGNTDAVKQYTLSTAWAVNTASYTRSFSVSSQSTGMNGLTFKPDGTKMYGIEQTTGSAHEYNLSTAWNISTASFSQSFNTSSGEAIAFSADGTLMFSGRSTTIKKYTLSTAWDISTASLTSTTDIGMETVGLSFKSDGLTMFGCDAASDEIKAYRFVDLSTITLPSAVVETPSAISSIRKTTYAFTTLNGGTTVNLIDDTPQLTATDAGAIGTYAILRLNVANSGSSYSLGNAGTLHAGSTLIWTNITNTGTPSTSPTLSGIWRNMSGPSGITGTVGNTASLFLRIS